MRWVIDPVFLQVKNIRIIGSWYINGQLYCPDYIKGEIYKVPTVSSELKSQIKTDSKQTFANSLDDIQSDINKVMVYKEMDFVVIKGVVRGSKIKLRVVIKVLTSVNLHIDRHSKKFKVPTFARKLI